MLDIGDRAPNFVLPDGRGTFTMFYERTRGLPVVLLFASPGRWPAHGEALDGFAEQAKAFEAAGVDIFCVSLDPPAKNAEAGRPFLVWSDSAQKITQWYFGQLAMAWPPSPEGPEVLALGLDANQRILWTRRGAGPGLADQILAGLHERPAPASPEIRFQTAPVLLVPRVLGSNALGLGVLGPDAAAIEDPAMQRRLVNLIGQRIAPELYKAFSFQGFRFGRLRLLAWPAGVPAGREAAPPEKPPASGKGRFEILVGLPGAPEGGALVFPEFGGHRYALPAGGAMIFSDALLREWQPAEAPRHYLQSYLEAASPGAPSPGAASPGAASPGAPSPGAPSR